MNRSIDGKPVLQKIKEKTDFLSIMRYARSFYQIKIFAYCIMDNHYHILLQNSSGRMAEFMRYLNGKWAIHYRLRKGGKGYVFQNRYLSTLIDADSYLDTVAAYILLNPVRAGLCASPWDYRFSSINEAFSSSEPIVDRKSFRDLFPSKNDLNKALQEKIGKDLKPQTTRLGMILGNGMFIKKSLSVYNRRKNHCEISPRKRLREDGYQSPEMITRNFFKINCLPHNKIPTTTFRGKRLRNRLLVLLREEAGLTYAQISTYPWFKDLKFSSLGRLYANAKIQMNRKKTDE
jgi:REP element-mobilizing transposase RayT